MNQPVQIETINDENKTEINVKQQPLNPSISKSTTSTVSNVNDDSTFTERPKQDDEGNIESNHSNSSNESVILKTPKRYIHRDKNDKMDTNEKNPTSNPNEQYIQDEAEFDEIKRMSNTFWKKKR